MSNAPGSGSGSGSGTTTTAQDGSEHSTGTAEPLDGSGSGSGSGPSSGSTNTTVQFGESLPIHVLEEAFPCGPISVSIPVEVGNPNPYSGVSVKYATQNGSALAGTDYTAQSGSLGFAPDSSGPDYINVPILDDGDDESVGNEYFTVSLSNPQGATLGAPSTFTVYIEEGPQQAATDTLRWNPCGNYASDIVTNWYDVTQKFQLQKGALGPNPSSPIQFDDNPNDAQNNTPISNAPITWHQSATVASITLSQYTGQMTLINGYNVGVTVQGAINEDTASSLKFDFQTTANKLIVQSNTSNLTNFNFSDQQGEFLAENAAWVNMGANYSETSTANIYIYSGATLDIKGDGGGLNLSGNNTEVYVASGGYLKLEPTGTHSLIHFGNLTSGEILENQGRVDVLCQAGVNSDIDIPVLNDGGQFNVNGGGNDQTQGGTFIIVGFDARTANAGFDMTGGQLNLFNSATLYLSSPYLQSGGSLQTLDAFQESLSSGAGGTAAVISGGKIVLDTDTATPEVGGHLVITCQSLNFSGGEYDPKIDGSNAANPNADLLELAGDGTLNLSGATLNVTVLNPPPVGSVTWTIVKYKSRSGTFNNGTLNGTDVLYNDDKHWVYLVKAG